MTEREGIPYSVDEAEKAALQRMDPYHRELMLFLVAEVRRLRSSLERLSQCACVNDTDGDGGCGRMFCRWCGIGGERDQVRVVLRGIIK